MNRKNSNFFLKARSVISGGVNSPVRAWKSVGGNPVFVSRAKGSKIYDVSGNEYIDYVLSWGPMILGHAHTDLISTLVATAKNGTSFGAPTEIETKMARFISDAIPSIERVRMTSSGTEAAMTAIRLARGYTGRNMIVKFDGCYHGHSDALLTKAGSGMATFGIPASPGVPKELARLTLSLRYNDIDAVEKTINKYGPELAAIIIEPVAGNMGVVLPQKGFLKKLRSLTKHYGIVLIFDEVITGFRFTFGGYQNVIDVDPDLTCLGKIIGGGLPVGALGGRKEIMKTLAPDGDIYQAGTLSGNPLALSAGMATLNVLKTKKKFYADLNQKTDHLCLEINNLFLKKGLAVCINRAYSMFTIFFQKGPVYDFQSAKKSDTKLFARFFHGMLKQGIWLPPSQYEACFLSMAHTDKEVVKTLDACSKTLKNL